VNEEHTAKERRGPSMKIALPVWENKISPVLDTASRLLIVEIKEGGEISRFEVFLDERNPSRRCHRILGMGVNAVICGAVTRHFSEMLKASGIKLIPGISGQPDDVLHACLEGNLEQPRFFMPGCTGDGLEEQLSALGFTANLKRKAQPGENKSHG
jgi:predicted Fe-Mo cluster-binding NifX family protein